MVDYDPLPQEPQDVSQDVSQDVFQDGSSNYVLINKKDELNISAADKFITWENWPLNSE